MRTTLLGSMTLFGLLSVTPVFAQQPAQPVYQPAQPNYGQPPQQQQYGQPPPQGPVYGQPPPTYVYMNQGMPGPKTMEYSDGDQIPPGYTLQSRARVGLIVGGSVMLGVAWLMSVLVAATVGAMRSTCSITNSCDVKPADWLYLPIAGPFIQMSVSEGAAIPFLIIDGLLQAGGLAMLVLGIALPKTVLVRNDLAVNEFKVPVFGKLKINPTFATTTSGASGFSLSGAF